MRKKSRLTITLSPQVLSKVDSTIDGTVIKNRSHAIEKLIEQGYKNDIDTAVILAGGNIISDTSQVLKKVNGEYLLAITIKQLKEHNFSRVVICSGSKIDDIKNVFGDGSEYGIKIDYVQEAQPMGTAGVLKLAQDVINSKNFLVIYGDILTDMNFTSFVDFYFSENKIASIGIKPRMGRKKYGQVSIQGNKVIGYSSKENNTGLSLVSTGIYVFSNRIFDYIESNKQLYLGRDIFPKLIDQEEMSAFIFQGIWYDISSSEDFDEAESRWS